MNAKPNLGLFMTTSYKMYVEDRIIKVTQNFNMYVHVKNREHLKNNNK